MLNINGSEIILIAILALLLFGPKRLPEIARQVGRAVSEVRKYSREFQREIKDATEPFAKEVRTAEQEARRTYAMDDDLSTFITPKPSDADPPTTS